MVSCCCVLIPFLSTVSHLLGSKCPSNTKSFNCITPFGLQMSIKHKASGVSRSKPAYCVDNYISWVELYPRYRRWISTDDNFVMLRGHPWRIAYSLPTSPFFKIATKKLATGVFFMTSTNSTGSFRWNFNPSGKVNLDYLIIFPIKT